MRVLWSKYGSRGDVEPMVGLAVRLRALGAQVRACALPDEDLEELLGRAGVPLVPIGRPMRVMVRPSSLQDHSMRSSTRFRAFSVVLSSPSSNGEFHD